MLMMTVTLGLIGCSSTREPNVVIAPTYSYVQADLANGGDVQTAQAAQERPLVATAGKLPPLPEAPGFETYVLIPTDPINR